MVSIIRSFFVSLEFVVSISGVLLCFLFPEWFLSLSQRVGQQSDVLKYAGLFPAGLVAYSLRASRSILFPDGDKHSILQGWSGYWELKCSVVAGIVYSLAFALAGVGTLLFDWKNPAAYQSAVLLTAVVGALTVSGTLFQANIRIEELFREHSKPKGSA
ncbi:MAG TPA: hypothetical protein PK640_07145 [Verrucomicrobiota bacterium]|nr:hypothetical protein [Verrucomicrobiota bacterium]